MYVCIYVDVYVCIFVFMYVCLYVCMYVRTYVCICVSVYLCICVSVYVYVYVYVYVCVNYRYMCFQPAPILTRTAPLDKFTGDRINLSAARWAEKPTGSPSRP